MNSANPTKLHVNLFGRIRTSADAERTWRPEPGRRKALEVLAYTLCSSGTVPSRELRRAVWGAVSDDAYRSTLTEVRRLLVKLLAEGDDKLAREIFRTEDDEIVVSPAVVSDVKTFLDAHRKHREGVASADDLREALRLSEEDLLVGYEEEEFRGRRKTGWAWVAGRREDLRLKRAEMAESLAGLEAGSPEKLSALVGLAGERLHGVLAEKGGAFSNKYVSDIYANRAEAEKVFQEFVGQRKHLCYVVTGASGMGKTCLLCHLAETLVRPGSRQLPLLVDAKALRLSEKRLDKFAAERFGFADVAALGSFLKKRDALLVIFIDAINELVGRDELEQFNAQLSELTSLIAGEQYPILFCLSCRTQSWPHFEPAGWATAHALRRTDGQVSVVLRKFDLANIDAVIADYFNFYRIEGALKGEARVACCEPLMLRFLCAAHTYRPKDDRETPPEEIEPYPLGEVTTLRRKDIFDTYAGAMREELSKITSEVLGKPAQPDQVYNLTTRYVISIAHRMLEERRGEIRLGEVRAVAEKIQHPDRRIDEHRLATDPKSLFFRLVDLGVFRPEQDPRTYSFVFEAYFEFSLGRYIARERWARMLLGGGSDPRAMEEDLTALITLHADLVKKDNFPNLFGAVRYAILDTEVDWLPDAAASKVGEERLYQDHPAAFVRLVRHLTETSALQFDWLQQSCHIIRESKLMQHDLWARLARPGEGGPAPRQARARAEGHFKDILRTLDKLTSFTDFVILWDLQSTLQTMAAANFEVTLREVEEWATFGKGLKPIFATQALAKLSSIQPDAVIELLSTLIKLPQYRSDYWLARSVIFATSELARILDEQRPARSTAVADAWRELRDGIFALARIQDPPSDAPYIRGAALPLLPFLSEERGGRLEEVSRLAGQETWRWALWNLAFELQNWPEGWRLDEDAWAWSILESLAARADSHLHYAIHRTLDAWAGRLEGRRGVDDRVNAIKETLSRRPAGAAPGPAWWPALAHGPADYSRSDLIGVVYAPAYLEPAYGNHVECRERLQAVVEKLEGAGRGHFNWITPSAAAEALLRNAHNPETDRHRDGAPWPGYVETVKEASKSQHLQEGPSELRFESFEIAKLAAGGVIEAIDYVQKSKAKAAFALTRPPGHLANNTICIFNNIAVGAMYAREQYPHLKRILIVDCDAHHGKHTQQVFLKSPDVVYFSMHIDNDYTREDGSVDHIGSGAGEGYTFNIPYPNHMGDEGYGYVVDNLLVPVAREFGPDLILVSAGFDGHFDDPLTPHCLLTDGAYVHLAARLFELAREFDVKIVGALEGGYGLTGLANSLVHMLGVWGEWPESVREKIGRTPEPEGQAARYKSRALDGVKQQVRRRVKLMAEVKERNPAYRLCLDGDHWAKIAAGAA